MERHVWELGSRKSAPPTKRSPSMPASSKLLSKNKGRVLLVRRRKDRVWTFPGGSLKARETSRSALRHELKEELPAIRLGKTKRLGIIKRRDSEETHAVFTVHKIRGTLHIGDKKEIDRVRWRNPWKARLTKTACAIHDHFL
jgi:8-oxo-dGTP diphosphatase